MVVSESQKMREKKNNNRESKKKVNVFVEKK